MEKSPHSATRWPSYGQKPVVNNAMFVGFTPKFFFGDSFGVTHGFKPIKGDLFWKLSPFI